MQSALDAHCSAPFRFRCLTNEKIPGVETTPLATKWQGWWTKLELFLPGQFDGPVAYLDLDTLILSDVTDILTRRYAFACPGTWKDGSDRILSSAFMCWDGTQDLSHIPAAFAPGIACRYERSDRWGDQGFIQDHLGRPWENLLKTFPSRILRYKSHCIGTTKEFPGAAPRGSSIVCFSGRPRPHELNWSLPFRAN